MHSLNTSVVAGTVAMLVLAGGSALAAPAEFRLVQQTPPTQGPNGTPDGQNLENDPSPRQPTPTQAPDADQPDGNNLSALDRQFMIEAARSGMAEVQLGQLAVQRAASDEVRQFGQRMIQDHTQANAQLMQLFSQKGISAPQDIGSEHQAIQAQLSNLSGASFDRAYMNYMVQEHNQDIAAFEQEVQQGQDPQVQTWARQTLPTLRTHLQQAQTIVNNLQAPGTDVDETEPEAQQVEPEAEQTEPVPALW